MELEDEERRREKRQQLQNRQKIDPLTPTHGTNTGAMDALLDKLRAAGPTPRDKREERRRRARARQGNRTVSATGDPDGEKPTDIIPSTVSDDLNPKSPDITVSTPEQTQHIEDALSSRTQEMLMKLRGDGGASVADATAAAFGKGNIRDKRKERRRRQGSNVSTSSANGALGIMSGVTPPMPALPGPGAPSILSPSLSVPGGEDDDPVARAKNALMEMRKASDIGNVGTQTPPPATSNTDADHPDCAIVVDDGPEKTE